MILTLNLSTFPGSPFESANYHISLTLLMSSNVLNFQSSSDGFVEGTMSTERNFLSYRVTLRLILLSLTSLFKMTVLHLLLRPTPTPS